MILVGICNWTKEIFEATSLCNIEQLPVFCEDKEVLVLVLNSEGFSWYTYDSIDVAKFYGLKTVIEKQNDFIKYVQNIEFVVCSFARREEQKIKAIEELTKTIENLNG